MIVASMVAADRDIDPLVLLEAFDIYPGRSRPDVEWVMRRILRSPPRGFASEAIRERIDELRVSAERQESRFQEFAEVLQSLTRDYETLKLDAHASFAIQSLGLDLRRVRMTRFLPVRLYVTRQTEDMASPLIEAVETMLERFGFEVADDFPAERGSVWKRWISRSQKALTHEEVQDVARKVKKGAEVAGLDKPMADVNKTQSEAIRNALEVAKDYDNVVLQFGSALAVVTTDGHGRRNAAAITLTPAQAIALENNPELLHSPRTVLERLKELCEVEKRVLD